MKDIGSLMCVILPLEILMLYLFYKIRLDTVVTMEGVYYRWVPFFRRYRFVERNIIEVASVDDSPVFNHQWVHMMKPGKGIHFHLMNDKQIFIGSANIGSFKIAVDKMIKGKN